VAGIDILLDKDDVPLGCCLHDLETLFVVDFNTSGGAGNRSPVERSGAGLTPVVASLSGRPLSAAMRPSHQASFDYRLFI
jgi:hypothetical protein